MDAIRRLAQAGLWPVLSLAALTALGASSSLVEGADANRERVAQAPPGKGPSRVSNVGERIIAETADGAAEAFSSGRAVRMTVVESSELAPAGIASGRSVSGVSSGAEGLRREAVALRQEPGAPLMGWLSAVVVPSPDGQRVLYHVPGWVRPIRFQQTWTQNGFKYGDVLAVPTIRLRDNKANTDVVFVEGAYSAAWGPGGSIAYVRGLRREELVGENYHGHVVVRPSLHGRPVQWTTKPAMYVVAGWAGAHLIVYTKNEDGGLSLYVLDGPGQVRTLSENAVLVAISPDGGRAFIRQRYPTVRVVNVADGSEVARLGLGALGELTGASGPVSVSYAGSWAGDRVVAAAASGLAIFRVDETSISVERYLEIDPTLFPMGVQEPRFVDATGERVVALGSRYVNGRNVDAGTVQLSLDCSGGQCLTRSLGRSNAFAAYSASRPLAGGEK